MKIKEQLQADINSQGFCHHQMAQVQRSCFNWLRDSSGKNVSNNTKVLINSIEDFCFQVKERLDALSPVTREIHDKIEQVVMDPLKAAVNVVENGNAQDHLDAIANLVDADFQMRQV